MAGDPGGAVAGLYQYLMQKFLLKPISNREVDISCNVIPALVGNSTVLANMLRASWGNQATAVSAKDVAKQRAQTH